MRLPVEEARNLAESVLTQAGLQAEPARIAADVLIEAELRGRRGHGLIRLPALAKHAGADRVAASVIDEGPTWAHLDGAGDIGYLTAHRAMSIAIHKAAEHGTGLVGVRHTTHCGMIGYYALMAAERDLIGLMTCNCSPRVAPFGGTTGVFGTNPIAIAVPGPAEPILVDLATSAATTGDLLVAIQEGKALQEGLAFDADGNPTTDPKEAREGALAAFGGHKGSALALVSQILSGALTGAAPLPEPGTDYGILVAAANPEMFIPMDQFKSGVDHVISAMKKAKPGGGVSEILYPGERSHSVRRETLAKGIEVDPSLLEELRNIST